jgi:hypothetical protein
MPGKSFSLHAYLATLLSRTALCHSPPTISEAANSTETQEELYVSTETRDRSSAWETGGYVLSVRTAKLPAQIVIQACDSSFYQHWYL